MTRLLERLSAYIHSDELTDEQRAICRESGSFVVRACPGSGKTRTVGTRLAWRMAHWNRRRSGIAALSFTNVAWQEIGHYMHDTLGFPSSPPHPHFLGTIDSFVNSFILSPFGHVVMKCSRKPEVVHPASALHSFVQGFKQRSLGPCMKTGCKPTSFAIAPNGGLEWCGERRQPACNRDHCGEMKRVMVQAGYALPTDAMYWGMKVVSDHPGVARILAMRFPEIIIDEAQDTTDIQYEILMQLWQGGSHVIMVGDPDQSIFEFSGGRPDRFLAFETACNKTLQLSKNFRSSRKICEATCLFSRENSRALESAGPWRDFPAKPSLLRYDPKQPTQVMDRYLEFLEAWALDAVGAAVLCWRHNLLRSLTGDGDLEWPKGVTNLAKILARAATYRDNLELVRSHELAMGALSEILLSTTLSRRELREKDCLRPWKRLSYSLLVQLPSSKTPLAEWGPKARVAVEHFLAEYELPAGIGLAQNLRRVNHQLGSAEVSAFVRARFTNQGVTFKVIHQAKGETYDAVMVVAGSGTKRRPGDLSQWLNSNGNFEAERRVGYVAVTRPRRLLVLAVPTDTPDHLVEQLRPYYDISP
ncbi:MAG: UvrD-helicase domain-containing protein [Desulfomonilaceae bacterium]